MAATTWSPAPWLGNQTWLLTDNAVVKTPPVESSTSGRRVRIAGETKSYPSGDISKILRSAVEEVAAQRGAEPWVIIGDTPDENLQFHGIAAPAYVSKPEFNRVTKFHLGNEAVTRGANSSIAFEFASEECPTITAIVWLAMHVDSSHDHIFASGITYRPLHAKRPENDGYLFWSGNPGGWHMPFGYYDHGDDVDAAREYLHNFKPVDGVEFYQRDYGKNSRLMVTDAIKLLRNLMDVQTIQLPVWRDPSTPSAMTFKATGRTTWNRTLYQEMLDHVQTSATIERIQANLRQIADDMRALGVAGLNRTTPAQAEFLLAVERAFGDDLGCHMIPVTTIDNDDEEALEGPVSVVEDNAHTVSIDFKTGTVVVHCTKDTSVLDQWNFERTKAEITGELDAFLGFARQAHQKRAKRRVSKIVKQRTVTEEDLGIEKFSA